MGFWGSLIIAVVGAIVGAILTFIVMRFHRVSTREANLHDIALEREANLHNIALEEVNYFVKELNRFLTQYGLRQETDDFRILLSNWGQIQNEVAGLRQSNNLLINSVKNIEGTDLSSPLDTTLEALEGFEEILSGVKIENEDIAEYVDELRDGFESLQEALVNIKRR